MDIEMPESDKPEVRSRPASEGTTREMPSGMPWESEPAAAEPPNLIGHQVGPIEILSKVGWGGFGTVYKGRHAKLNRIVAVKVLTNPIDRTMTQLFYREARAIAALEKSPHIVQIFDCDEYQGRPYIVFEFIEGNAARLIEQQPGGLDLSVALRIAIDAADGLAHAHRENLLHRDVKPANILIDVHGKPKLGDFGLARFTRDSAGHSGFSGGSPPYMPPEQIRGAELDERSDIFSLGVSLYEMLTGQRAFPGDNVNAMLHNICQGNAVPIRERRSDLPDAVVAAVERAMAAAREDRFARADDFAAELRRCLLAIERTGQAPPGPALRKPALWRSTALRAATTALAFAVACLLALGLWWWSGTRRAEAGLIEEGNRVFEAGRPAEAEACYRRALAAVPASDAARYGLGYALLRQGDAEAARTEFAEIDDAARRAEGSAAAALTLHGPEARPEAEQAREAAGPGYADVLLARLDLIAQQFREAQERLAGAREDVFHFRWQFDEALVTLAQACYKNGDTAAMQAALAAAGAAADPAQRDLAAHYARLAAAALDAQRRDEVRAQAARIAERLAAAPESAQPQDLWTSRPLTFFVAPLDGAPTPAAVAMGLPDLLPELLGNALDGTGAFNLVDRSFLAQVLLEQELSTALASPERRLELGRVLGARLMIVPRLVRQTQGESILLMVQDVETTERLPAAPLALPRAAGVDQVAALAAQAIREAARRAYPVQGRLYARGGAPEINAGAAAGVREGMVFEVFTDPAGPPLGETARVEGAPGAERCAVRVPGLDPGALPTAPEQGWYVREYRPPGAPPG